MKSAIETLQAKLRELEAEQQDYLYRDEPEAVKAEQCATDATAHRRAIFVLELSELAIDTKQPQERTFWDSKAPSRLDTSIGYRVFGCRYHSPPM